MANKFILRIIFSAVSLVCFILPMTESVALDFGVGTHLQLLLPNNLTDFRTQLPVYGLNSSLQFGSHRLEMQLSRGTADGVEAILSEANYSFEWTTPFLQFLVISGVHYLSYQFDTNPKNNQLGLHVGPGIRLKLGETVTVPLYLKIFLEEPTVTAFGGSISFEI